MSEYSVRDFVIRWNNTFPIDKWYRDKYNIKFNSTEHRKISFGDVLFEFIEKQVYDEALNNVDYEPNKGKFFKGRKKEKEISYELAQEEFSKINLNDFDD